MKVQRAFIKSDLAESNDRLAEDFAISEKARYNPLLYQLS